MTKYVQKKTNYIAKQEAIKGRFGFEYNESKINYRTEIPALPEKLRQKPDERVRDRRIQQIQQKMNKLKEIRHQKKNLIKELNKKYNSQYLNWSDKLNLGKKCIEVLTFDQQGINYKIKKINQKLEKIQFNISQIYTQIRNFRIEPQRKIYKKLEEMTIRELNHEKQKIQNNMLVKNLSKKQQMQCLSQIKKIELLKFEQKNSNKIEQNGQASEKQILENLQKQLQKQKQNESNLKREKGQLIKQKHQFGAKINDIYEDIRQFYLKMKQSIEKQQNNSQTAQLSKQTKGLKQSIYKLRQDIQKVKTQFQQKVHQYQVEQQRIKWINWANSVKKRLQQQWQQEKAQRKKLKNKQKFTQKTQQKGVTGTQQTKPAFQKKKINKNQKQIDACTFLIDYCNSLYPEKTSNVGSTQSTKVIRSVADQLKKGAWAKQKGIQVIESKKSKKDIDEQHQKKQKKKQPQIKQQQIIPSNRFSHKYFIAQYFDSVKAIPPTKVEQLDKIIQDLEDKRQYYLAHGDQIIEKKQTNGNKPHYEDKKNIKSKGSKQNIINSQQFPEL